MKTSTVSVRFHYDFAAKTIWGTKASFDKASKGFGPVYEELAEKMAKHPTFGIEIAEPATPVKPKQTYKGMTIKFMLDYASAVGHTDFHDEMERVNNYHKNGGEIEFSVYPVIKCMFFEHFAPGERERFAYEKAKTIVRKYRHDGIISAVNSHTERVDEIDSIEELPLAVNS